MHTELDDIATKFNNIVVTVTYGNRWSLLKLVLKRLLKDIKVSRIIVVDNGSTYEINKNAQEFDDERLLIINLGRNTGSAYGYKVGIQAALEQINCEYIWLLDDDNLPAREALDELTRSYSQCLYQYSHCKFALVSIREDREILKKSAEEQSSTSVYPRKSSFWGFHIFDIPFKLVKLLDYKYETKKTRKNLEAVEVPYCPYGGLYFHKDLVKKIGYPDERFFVYADDTEFTSRISRSGGKLFLVPTSVVEDIDTSWHLERENSSSFYKLLISSSDFRVYYAVRNQIYFEDNHWKSSKTIFLLNKFLFLSVLLIYTLKYRKFSRFKIIFNAISDAEKGNLGERKDLMAL